MSLGAAAGNLPWASACQCHSIAMGVHGVFTQHKMQTINRVVPRSITTRVVYPELSQPVPAFVGPTEIPAGYLAPGTRVPVLRLSTCVSTARYTIPQHTPSNPSKNTVSDPHNTHAHAALSTDPTHPDLLAPRCCPGTRVTRVRAPEKRVCTRPRV